MAFEVRPYPEWSWSKSRDLTFEECPRKYYYQYYGSHNGWLRDADETARHIYKLKQITNLYLIFGESLHEIAKNSIKAFVEKNQLPEYVTLFQYIRNTLNKAYSDSKDRASWYNYPKQHIMLHEMYYNNSLPRDRVNTIKGRMETCLHNFLNSKSFSEIINSKDIQIVELDETLNHMMLDGEKIFVRLDLLYRKNDGTWVVSDWKTGQEEESIDEQLSIYAMYVNKVYNVPLNEIEIRTEYLLTGECKVDSINTEKIEKTRESIMKSIESMRSCLEDPIINKPYTMDKFPVRPKMHKCGGCNFREICSEKYI